VSRPGGRPAPPTTLIFYPQDQATRRKVPTVVPDPGDGTFRVSCVPGKYKVTLVPGGSATPAKPGGPEGAPAGPAPRSPWGLPESYQSASSTPWLVEIPVTRKADLVRTSAPHQP